MNLELDLKDFKKSYGENSMRLATELPELDIVSSGSVSLDYILGVGGYPRGMMVQIMGPYASGKTVLAYYAIAEAQKKGIQTALINLEGIFDVGWAEEVSGLDGKKLAIGEPAPGIETVHMVTDVVHSGKFGLVVVDSIGAMIDDREIQDSKGNPGKIQPGGAAGLVTASPAPSQQL